MNKKIEIESNLLDIKAYVESTLNYFDNEDNKNIDKDEIIAYLSTVPETVEETKKLFQEVELEYEQEILDKEKWYE